MKKSLEEMSTRLNKLRFDYEYNVKVRRESIDAALKAIAALPEEDIDALTGFIPMLKVVRGYTAQDLYDNIHGEIAQVVDVVEQLEQFIEQRLAYLESQL